jgi:hypothetical protein
VIGLAQVSLQEVFHQHDLRVRGQKLLGEPVNYKLIPRGTGALAAPNTIETTLREIDIALSPDVAAAPPATGPPRTRARRTIAPELLVVAAESGADGTEAHFTAVRNPLRAMDNALVMAAQGLLGVCGDDLPPEIVIRVCFAVLSVADGAARMDGSGSLADPIAQLRRQALCCVRRVLADGSPELRAKIDDLLLTEARRASELATVTSRDPDTQRNLEELRASNDAGISQRAEEGLEELLASAQQDVLRDSVGVAERLRQALLAEGLPDPQGALVLPPEPETETESTESVVSGADVGASLSP